MSTDNIRETLDAHPFFHGMAPEFIDVIASTAEMSTVQRGSFILNTGDTANYFYVLVEGRVAIESPAGIDGPITIDTLKAGDILGWSTFQPPFKWQFDALCMEDCSVIVLDGVRLRALCESNGTLGYELLQRIITIVSKRLQAARMQLMQFYV